MVHRALVVFVLAVATLVALAGDADAQRRRRRRPPQEPPPTEEPAEETPPEGAQTPPAEGTTPDAGLPALGTESGAPGTPGAPGTEPPPAEGAPGTTVQGEDELEPVGPDLGPIREEFTALMDELVQARSKVAVLGRQLFHTRMRVVVQNRAGDDNTLGRAELTLDGAPIFRGGGSELQSDIEREVFDGFAAPGPHVLTVEVEQRQRADDDFRYTLRDSYRFQVVRNRMTDVVIILDDDSDMGEDFPDDGEGEFDVRTRLRVASRALDAR